MRQKQILSLLQSGYTTVAVSYNTDQKVDILNLRENRLYTFKTNLTLQENDLVIVPNTSGGFKVVRVVEVHNEPQIDLDADYDYKWVVQLLDTTAYNAILENEKELLKTMAKLEQNRQRTDAQKQIKEMYGGDVPMLDYSKGRLL